MLLLCLYMRFGILYYLANDLNVIKDVEIIEAKNIDSAKRITDRNLEENIVVPLNESNIMLLKKLLKDAKQKTE